ISCKKQIVPTGDFDTQIQEIKAYFKGVKGKKPENFICE
ncbi:MAG: acyltransferase, partial [Bacteroidaceae bacterium]|nr:acyltransferase [Bacteroidaceae bacterium]